MKKNGPYRHKSANSISEFLSLTGPHLDKLITYRQFDEVLASTSDDSAMTYGPSDHESSLVLYRVYPGVHTKTRLVLVLSRRVRRALVRVYALDVRARSIDRSIVHSCPVSSSFVGHALDRETRARVERRATAGAMKRRFRPRATATTTTTTRGVGCPNDIIAIDERSSRLANATSRR